MQRTLLLFISSSFAAGIAMQACSGDNATVDAGPDATASDASSDVVSDTKPNNDGSPSNCPTYTGSVPLCQAAITHCQTCGYSGTACDKANFTQECEALAAFYSTQCENAFVSAATSCDASVSCDFTSFLDASLTTGQAKAANDYCAKCGDGGGCVTNIVSNAGLALYSDSICDLIDTACTPDASTQSACSLSHYQLCAFGVAGANAPKNPCADAGTD